jgi:hypothetical protein
MLDEYLAKIFSHFVGYFFILLIVSFTVQKFFNLLQSHLLIHAQFPESYSEIHYLGLFI